MCSTAFSAASRAATASSRAATADSLAQLPQRGHNCVSGGLLCGLPSSDGFLARSFSVGARLFSLRARCFGFCARRLSCGAILFCSRATLFSLIAPRARAARALPLQPRSQRRPRRASPPRFREPTKQQRAARLRARGALLPAQRGLLVDFCALERHGILGLQLRELVLGAIARDDAKRVIFSRRLELGALGVVRVFLTLELAERFGDLRLGFLSACSRQRELSPPPRALPFRR